jgi:hypothetical protein
VLLFGQRLGSPGHCSRHVDGPLAGGPVMSHKHDRLGSVLKHQRHLQIVGQFGFHVGGQADRHGKVDVG